MKEMSPKLRKQFEKLNARIRGYDEMCERAEKKLAGSSKMYRKPGSMNPKK